MPAFDAGIFCMKGNFMEKRQKGLKGLIPYAYITPITAILVLFVVGSVIISICLSFTDYNIMTPPVFDGLDNYQKLLDDSKFIKAFKNTIKLMILIVPLQMVSGVVVATFLVANRKRLLGKIANWIVFIPVLCSNAVVGVVWRELLNGKLPIMEAFFGLFGIEPNMLLGDAKTALIVVGMVAVWKSLGYYVVIFSSGLLGISEEYYESAKVDGANTIKRFFSITLPMLKPTLIMALFLSITNSLQCFDLIFNLTGGGPNNSTTTLVIYAYDLCFKSGKAGYAMAVANVLFVVILIVALMQRRMMSREASEI